MLPGEIVAERFEVEGLAGSGGMSTVYRAKDTLTGEPVAIKVLAVRDGPDVERFTREARLLAELRHPGIVGYVAHGRTTPGDYYLAMEWLEGETLSARLQRAPLSVRDAVRLVSAVAEALGTAHARGVVHRDLKPSNLFLKARHLDGVKVLDFGVARLGHALDRTRTGMILGTPGYMAPEQARGDREVGPEADVFSLGCVLFECLTGRPPFVGERIMAVLAKILLEEAPRVADLRPEVPAELDQLVARMLAKSPDARPVDARALVDDLAGITVASTTMAPPSSVPPAITTGEQRLLCVVVASEETRATREETGELLGTLRAVVAPYGGRIDLLAGGSVVWSIAGDGVASDQAAQAARGALALRGLLPKTPMALATGRGMLSAQWSMGEVIDRAARMLNLSPRAASTDDAKQPIRIDDVTAGLLSARFELGGDEHGLELRGVRDVIEPTRTLLGKATPCVGRDREIATLLSLYDECVSEPVARAVLVTAPAGTGKSRVRYELIHRLKERGQPLEIWTGRGDPMKIGSPFGILAPAIRRALGVLDGEPAPVREQKLRARVGRHLRREDLARVTAFLGELCGVRIADADADGETEESAQLRAARRDPILMGDQMQKAWEDWLAAECRAQPVLLLLEDLHWGDLPTVKFIDAALRNLKDLPFMVLALARPEVHDMFPTLWDGRGLEEIRLKELTRKACENLVRQVLGEGTAPELVAQLVTHAEGNAFYLEELVRSVAETGSHALPETVLAMVQARLERLASEERRVLRAGSVFGQVFWRGGVHALLGRVTMASDVDDWLAELVSREVITRRSEGRFPREDEFIFRHALVREAAYAMLPDDDRELGHRLAAEWLEAVGERDATVLAEHFERGGRADRAIAWYGLAAEDALEGNDLGAALARSKRAIECGATGDALGGLALLRAEVYAWRGERQEAKTAALEALKLLPSGAESWYAAAAIAINSCARLGDFAGVVELASSVPKLDASAKELVPAQVTTLARAVPELLQIGRSDLAAEILAPLAAVREAPAAVGPDVLAWIENALAWSALFDGDTGESLKFDEAAARSFERAGDERNACRQWLGCGYEQVLLGAFADAEKTLRDALAAATRMGLHALAVNAKHNLGPVLARRGAFDEAIALETEAIESYKRLGDSKLHGASEHYLAIILMLKGDLEGAQAASERCLTELSAFLPLRPRGLATSAKILLRLGRNAEALERATAAITDLEAQGHIEDGVELIRLAYAEALHAVGQTEAARAAISSAKKRLLAIAEKIKDPELHRGFLERVPENAQTLALAEAWGAE